MSKDSVDMLGQLVSPSFKQTNLSDWVINLVGFIPFGFLLVRVRRLACVTSAVMCCATLSLSIEIGQLFFEMRSPQVLDLVLNTLGGGIGAWISVTLTPIIRQYRNEGRLSSKSV